MKKLVVVLGMGRSGTSLMCQALETMGINFGGPLLGSHLRNERGHYEHLGIQGVHRKLMRQFGIETWLFRSLPATWLQQADTAEDELAGILEQNRENFGVKDPWLTRLLPLWQRVFLRLEIEPKYILCLRDPGTVYKSLVRCGEIQRDADTEAARRSVYEVWAEYLHDGAMVKSLRVWYEDWHGHEEYQRRRIAEWIGSQSIGRCVYDKELNHALA